jgi:hypothetical protein
MIIFPIGPLVGFIILYSIVLAADSWKEFVFVYAVGITVITLLVRNRRRKDERRRDRERQRMAEQIAAAFNRLAGSPEANEVKDNNINLDPKRRKSWFVG